MSLNNIADMFGRLPRLPWGSWACATVVIPKNIATAIIANLTVFIASPQRVKGLTCRAFDRRDIGRRGALSPHVGILKFGPSPQPLAHGSKTAMLSRPQ